MASKTRLAPPLILDPVVGGVLGLAPAVGLLYPEEPVPVTLFFGLDVVEGLL